MSHNVNYGHDRLANYVFSKLIYLISTWTRIHLSGDVPTYELARKYFDEYHPEERMPVFTVRPLAVRVDDARRYSS